MTTPFPDNLLIRLVVESGTRFDKEDSLGRVRAEEKGLMGDLGMEGIRGRGVMIYRNASLKRSSLALDASERQLH